jgi:hypothetical protein
MEESRDLSGDELALRFDARAALELSSVSQAGFWKQHGNFRAVREGDENTCFFHAMALQCRRRNQIGCLDVGGDCFVSHQAKADALHSSYAELLGLAQATSWAFDIDALYVGVPQAGWAEKIIGPFGECGDPAYHCMV